MSVKLYTLPQEILFLVAKYHIAYYRIRRMMRKFMYEDDEQQVDRILLLHAYREERRLMQSNDFPGKRFFFIDRVLKVYSMRTTLEWWDEICKVYLKAGPDVRAALFNHYNRW